MYFVSLRPRVFRVSSNFRCKLLTTNCTIICEVICVVVSVYNSCSVLSHKMCAVIKDKTKEELYRASVSAATKALCRSPASREHSTAKDVVTNGQSGMPCKTSCFDPDTWCDDRFKIVVQVVVGQDMDQSVLFSSRCVWNADTDCLASATYRNDWLFAVGVVFGLQANVEKVQISDCVPVTLKPTDLIDRNIELA
jgi:AhpD family alkylhydroperoxidase